MDFNLETIQTFLNTPIGELTRDTVAIEQAKENLKTFECFKQLLDGRLELFDKCSEVSILNLLESMGRDPTVDRSYILGYKAGIKSLKDYLDRYQTALDYLKKQGE